MADEVVFYKHRVGDGLHYITDNFQVFPDNSFQLGDSSEICILYALHLLCARNNVGRLHDLWNAAYPDDPMLEADLADIVWVGIQYTERFNPTSPDDISLVIEDVHSLGLDALADHAAKLLREKGIPI